MKLYKGALHIGRMLSGHFSKPFFHTSANCCKILLPTGQSVSVCPFPPDFRVPQVFPFPKCPSSQGSDPSHSGSHCSQSSSLLVRFQCCQVDGAVWTSMSEASKHISYKVFEAAHFNHVNQVPASS